MTTDIKFDVVFRYRDDAADPQDDMGGWERETFPTKAEAEAFAQGVAYGDEPQYEVDEIVECAHP